MRFLVTFRSKFEKMQWFILRQGLFLDNGCKLAVGKPNSRWKNKCSWTQFLPPLPFPNKSEFFGRGLGQMSLKAFHIHYFSLETWIKIKSKNLFYFLFAINESLYVSTKIACKCIANFVNICRNIFTYYKSWYFVATLAKFQSSRGSYHHLTLMDSFTKQIYKTKRTSLFSFFLCYLLFRNHYLY